MSDLHIVIHCRRTDDGLGYRIVTPPLTWRAAQAEWDRLDAKRRGSTQNFYEVRSVDDPQYAVLPPVRLFTPTKANLAWNGSPPGYRAAKYIAKRVGVTGRRGGWIYNSRGEILEQGWGSYAERCCRTGSMVRIGLGGVGHYGTSWYVPSTEYLPRADRQGRLAS
jgi:hypothetical protein